MSEFVITFLTILIATRIGVYLAVARLDKNNKPRPETTFLGIRIHHYVYGIILTVLAIIFNSQILLGIGLALFIDELPVILMGGSTHEENYSLLANIGVLVFGALVVIFNQQVFDFFLS
jgi:hypothetical protein